jgi:hypothetical protein
MIQLVEREDRYRSKKQCLGNGQKIEAEMANAIGTKIFRVHAPEGIVYVRFSERHRHVVASKLREWNEDGCTDMSDCIMAFSDDFHNPN